MSQFSFSASTTFKKRELSSLLLSDFFHICFFILSHPLYFSYFIFFSPYLLKLLSFLSPLFITTFLLLLVLLTFSPNLVQEHDSHSELSESGVGFLVGTCQSLFERLQSKGHDEDENSPQVEDLEVYKIVFDTSTFEIREPAEVLELEVKEVCSEAYGAPVDKRSLDCGGNFIGGLESLTGNSDAYPAETIKPGIIQQIVDVRRLECFFDEKNGLDTMWGMEEEKEVNQPGVESYKVEERTEKLSTRSGSEAVCNKTNDTTSNSDHGGKLNSKMRVNSRRLFESMESPSSDGEYYSPAMENYQTFDSNLGSFGSMRKEKEWRRTLACKLFEERHNVDGSEGMDSLWETYETESSKVQAKSNKKKGKKSGVEYEDEDEEEEDMDAQLCCLQALKFSAGKMNLGMGRPNLVKISKALKGIGWLHNLGRNGKKVYH